MKKPVFAQQRQEILREVAGKTFDVIIIGGGITGAGIALDATARGMSAVLFEMQDFAAGTSSRSTKLVHGGLRYLKQLEVKLVAEVGKERAIVYENGPHVTSPEWMLLPIYKGGTFGKWSTSIGLRIYDYLADVKKSERRTMLTASQTMEKEPLLKQEGLLGGGYYVEYRTDDARLTIEVMKKAVECGAKALNYAKVNAFIYEKGRAVGVSVVDQITGKSYQVFAKKIINATGPWVDTLREKDHSLKGKHLILSKGIHLVFDKSRFPLKQAIYFDTSDGRMVFAIPRDGKTYVGTTDTFYEGDLAHPKMTVEDRDYLLRAIHDMFPTVGITAEDVESSWAGLRPLIHEVGKSPSEISRKDEIWTADSGVITIAGGKLTGYRKMAETIVDRVAQLLKEEGNASFSPCQTKKLPISGGDFGGSAHMETFVAKKAEQGEKAGLSRKQAERLARLYGTNVDRVFELAVQLKKEAAELQLPVDVLASLQYGLEEEMVVKPEDFFIRRTGALFFNIHFVRQWKESVIHYMAKTLEWSEAEQHQYQKELETYLHDAVTPVQI
ncbi:FAD-dependent oxidoreductase [Anoxybacillus rupiensis]|uniref:glycerol-3-phosphate dehydrogenase/oxidase n=1 Tax=Anoxybacteroides rupiense TaxID=311460 RepID=UPI001BA63C7E|nr:FAD-dependent oxidoreductase [Anoxybacillus rupiensis]MBS2771150.1 FAD-dependent oxidoreductase [Anoxybacillus rupiensis]